MIRIQLPRGAFANSIAFNRSITGSAGNRIKGVKTLFPEHFKIPDIAKAGNQILRQNKRSKEGVVKGIYNGIKVSVQRDIKTNKIKSVYPCWNQ